MTSINGKTISHRFNVKDKAHITEIETEPVRLEHEAHKGNKCKYYITLIHI